MHIKETWAEANPNQYVAKFETHKVHLCFT